jgi:hypothetical protein
VKLASDEVAGAASAEPVPSSPDETSLDDPSLDSPELDSVELDSLDVDSLELLSVGAGAVPSDSPESPEVCSDDEPEDSSAANAIAPPLPAASARIAAPVNIVRRWMFI